MGTFPRVPILQYIASHCSIATTLCILATAATTTTATVVTGNSNQQADVAARLLGYGRHSDWGHFTPLTLTRHAAHPWSLLVMVRGHCSAVQTKSTKIGDDSLFCFAVQLLSWLLQNEDILLLTFYELATSRLYGVNLISHQLIVECHKSLLMGL